MNRVAPETCSTPVWLVCLQFFWIRYTFIRIFTPSLLHPCFQTRGPACRESGALWEGKTSHSRGAASVRDKYSVYLWTFCAQAFRSGGNCSTRRSPCCLSWSPSSWFCRSEAFQCFGGAAWLGRVARCSPPALINCSQAS